MVEVKRGMSTKEFRKILAIVSGWSIFILECADGSLFSGMARSVTREIATINTVKSGIYFSTHPDRLPVKLIYEEAHLCFPEAYVKFRYLRDMNKTMKKRLMRKKTWPIAGPYKAYFLENKLDIK